MPEQIIGFIRHYYNQLGVAAVHLEGELGVGDTIHIKGDTTDFVQEVKSIQRDHKNMNKAGKGEDVGIRIQKHARENDIVYKLVEEQEKVFKNITKQS
jgi:putative protease